MKRVRAAAVTGTTARRSAPALLLALLLGSPALAAPFAFALVGDTPYSPEEEAAFVGIMRDLDAQPLAFVAHVGDFKDGWTSCSDAVFMQRRQLFAASHHPFVYLPGDNEWVDCARALAGRYDPLERLARLRKLFFSAPRALGATHLALERQSDAARPRPYPEHVRWAHEKVLFAGFNLPGGDNNARRMPAEHMQRNQAAREWLSQAFSEARSRKLSAVVVLIHANPFASGGQIRFGFGQFIEDLRTETARFDGEVLLVHGDTHHYRVDQPLRSGDGYVPLGNFTRVEVYGSPYVNWVRVRVDEVAGRVTFAINPGR